MLSISNSVGRSGSNLELDVAAVRQRLVELGFTWVGEATKPGPIFISTIELFQSIKNGYEVIGGTKVDGRIDPNGDTILWLNALNAPRWQRMTAESEGIVNFEAQQLGDHHDFGTSWLDRTICDAARRYQQDWRAGKNAAPIAVNDASLPQGGRTPSHKGHQTGLMCDLRLPCKDGGSGNITTADASYDRETMRAQMIALRAEPLVEEIFLNDHVLIAAGLCESLVKHDDHAHVKIRPPARH
jgi:hypothetical protein